MPRDSIHLTLHGVYDGAIQRSGSGSPSTFRSTPSSPTGHPSFSFPPASLPPSFPPQRRSEYCLTVPEYAAIASLFPADALRDLGLEEALEARGALEEHCVWRVV